MVIAFSEEVTKLMDNKQHCLGIALDISKAFDIVSMPILLSKLVHLGIRGTALDNYFVELFGEPLQTFSIR